MLMFKTNKGETKEILPFPVLSHSLFFFWFPFKEDFYFYIKKYKKENLFLKDKRSNHWGKACVDNSKNFYFFLQHLDGICKYFL